jgi:hypothetical protein
MKSPFSAIYLTGVRQLVDSLTIFFGENFIFNVVNISSAMIHPECRKCILCCPKNQDPFFGSFASYSPACLAWVGAAEQHASFA